MIYFLSEMVWTDVPYKRYLLLDIGFIFLISLFI